MLYPGARLACALPTSASRQRRRSSRSANLSAMRAELATAAARQARQLGHHWLGAEHMLLAVTARSADELAPRALARVGVTYERTAAVLREYVAVEGPPIPREYSGILSSPTFHEVDAAATAVGLARGHNEPTSEDLLVALLTLPADGPVGVLLTYMETTPEAVGAVLEAEGVPVDALWAGLAVTTLLPAAARLAIAQGREHVFEGDVMLALLSGDPDPLARDVLGTLGLTYASFCTWVDESSKNAYPPIPPPRPGVAAAIPSPAVRQLFGRAQGFASSLGDGIVRSEHGLLAWLWEPWGSKVLELERLSVSPEAVLDALSAAGVRVPRMPLPEPDREPWGDRIEVPLDRMTDVVRELERENLPLRSWGFNQYDGTGWVAGWARLDLRAIVAKVLQRQA